MAFAIVRKLFLVYNARVRLDLFLKSSRLIKRRAVARELCDNGRVLVNDRQAKPGKELKPGDSITLRFSNREIDIEVVSLPASRGMKTLPEDLYRVASEKRISAEGDSWNKNP